MIYWGLFYIGVIIDIYLIFTDWNTWTIPFEIRFYIGIPLIFIGSAFLIWSIYILGIKNTTGLKDGFIVKMPYDITRNPQYLSDIILLIGLILFVNSLIVSVVFLLTIILFFIMPIPEEIWLEEQYGKEYLDYKYKTSRFL
jgi:protein-S-isoprenylcysteine O-methyltransferase Ste14